MRVAFIPPKGMASYAERGDIIMCLAQLLTGFDDSDYPDAIRELSKDKFTLLDNGANEGSVLSHYSLDKATTDIFVNEVVLPDVIGNTTETLNASKAYLKSYYRPSLRYMGVVQGSTPKELEQAIDMYATVLPVTTLGLPRLLLKRMGPSIRINMASWIAEHYGKRFDIHFLGACSSWIKEPYYASRYVPFVRSIDTSLPFNYGLAGVLIRDYTGVTTDKIDRPHGYFERRYETNGRTTISQNLAIYKEWCNGKKAPSGQL